MRDIGWRGGRLFKNHDSAEYACRFTALGRREHFKLGTVKKKPRRRRRRRYIAPSRARDGRLLWRNSNPKRRSKGVKQLSKLEASGLIDEMLDTYGGSNRQGNHGGSNRRNGSAYNGSAYNGSRSRKDAA